jgi:hypothetical protein
MNLSLETLKDFGKTQTLVQNISYTTKGKYNKTNGLKKDEGKKTLLEEMGLEQSDITIKVENHKVLITNKPYIEVLQSLRSKEIDQEGLKIQFATESADLQLAIKEATEVIKEKNSEIKAKGKRNGVHSISGVLSQYKDEERFYLNYYPIYESKNIKRTTLIKGVEATAEELAQLEQFKSKAKGGASSTIKEFNFQAEIKFRTIGLDNII